MRHELPLTPQRGVSLIELMAAMSLLALITLGLGYVYAGAWASWRAAEARLRLHQALDLALGTLREEVRTARQIEPLGASLRLRHDDTLAEPQAVYTLQQGRFLRNGEVPQVLSDSGVQWIDMHCEALRETGPGLFSVEVRLRAASEAETLNASTRLLSRNGPVVALGAAP